MKLLKWTPEQDAYLLEHYETRKPIAEIIEHTGHPMGSVWKRGKALGLTRPRDLGVENRSLTARQLRVLCLAARPEGVSVAELGLNPDGAASTIAALRRRGLLFSGVLGPRTVHNFTTQAAADRWVAANKAAHMAKQKPSFSIKARPGWEADAPMVITPNTKYTIAPPPPAQVFRTNTFQIL